MVTGKRTIDDGCSETLLGRWSGAGVCDDVVVDIWLLDLLLWCYLFVNHRDIEHSPWAGTSESRQLAFKNKTSFV